jgi:S-adenosylmethionine:tRNA ribosyltransferase-isomerase
MNKSDFYFDLPQELIAQTPLDNRDSSRLLCMDRVTGELKHRLFNELPSLLQKGDCLVLNDSRVLPARLFGATENQGKVEILLLREVSDKVWECLVKPGKKLKNNANITFCNGEMTATVRSVEGSGNRIIEFECDGSFHKMLEKLGQMPLPPYIFEKLEDKERYQTVYSNSVGSVAAPTAGLHFTKELLDEIKSKGVDICYVTLHVGLGTFRPVKSEKIVDHIMHEEYFSISEKTAHKISKTKKNGNRVIAVGTTSCRVLESVANESGYVQATSGETGIFIYPSYRFKCIDGLITNFHLPESTLIMLVSAFAGRENTLKAYAEAIRLKYRFFSFGDAMFVW